MEETLYLTVNLIDRFLALQPVVRKKLQLVGVTAMLLASKYEEVSVPVVEDLVLISDRAYSRQEVLQMVRIHCGCLVVNDMYLHSTYIREEVTLYDLFAFTLKERLMVNALRFNLSLPTPYVFMRRFLKAAEADKKVS